MYKRVLDLNLTLKRKSVFLLGPRQTGKSTFLKKEYPEALYINLLKNSEFQKYSANPSLIQEVVEHYVQNSKKFLVIVDEIQKIPALLDEVHHLIESNKSLRFILTGSSARKLKRGGANLLGGRASWYNFYPLCFAEMDHQNYKKWLKRLSVGALPSIIDSTDPIEDLKDYVGLYIKEEIVAEGLSRSVQNFSRFLDFVALANGEQINYTSIASDAQLSASTVRDYFEILSDTLIGHTLPAFLETKKRKALSSSKFYLFDYGVANALVGRKEVSYQTPEYGKSLEQAIYLELKAYIDYHRLENKIEYWRSTSQFEVDFLVYDSIKSIVAIEVKSSESPHQKNYKGLLALEEDVPLKRKIVVCHADSARITKEGIEIMPIELFLRQLWAGKIIYQSERR